MGIFAIMKIKDKILLVAGASGANIANILRATCINKWIKNITYHIIKSRGNYYAFFNSSVVLNEYVKA